MINQMNLNERTLVQKLDRILKKEFGTNLSFREFSAGYGIADLVFAENFSFRRSAIKRDPITNFDTLKILLTLEARPYAFSELSAMFPHLNKIEMQKQLRILRKNLYLKTIEKNIYMKTVGENEPNPIQRIAAVEVKLSDHRGGLIQARRYQYFADESYLAILKAVEKNIDIGEFNRNNIGLILFDAETNTIEIRNPQRTNDKFEMAVSLFAKEMMVSRFLTLAS
jgi:hypothetical protein